MAWSALGLPTFREVFRTVGIQLLSARPMWSDRYSRFGC